MYASGDFSRVPADTAKKLNTMKEVALVGPRMVCRELEKRGATMAAKEEQIMP
jgi:hypothetical protein